MDATLTTSGDWTCEVIPNDGVDDGPSAISSVSVEDSCQSLSFTATEYVDVGSDSELTHPGSEFTAEAWIYWDGTNVERNLIFSTHTNSSNGWDIQINTSNQWMILHRSTNGNVLASSSSSATVGWHHVAGVFSNVGQVITVELYVDGSLVASNSQNGTFANDGTEYLFLGNINEPMYGHPSPERQFYGLISMAKISSVGLYNGSFTPEIFGVDNNTVALWDFFGGGNTVVDASGNSHDGTLNGTTWENTCPEEDLDGDGYVALVDCDDNNSSIHPYAGDTYGDGIDSDCDGWDCAAEYNGDDYFVVCYEESSWQDAHSACQAAGYDGLTLIENTSQQSTLESLANSISVGDSREIWMGQNDIATEGDWDWIVGSGSYDNWLPGQPGQQGDEDCGMSPEYDNYQWIDVPCSRNYWMSCSSHY